MNKFSYKLLTLLLITCTSNAEKTTIEELEKKRADGVDWVNKYFDSAEEGINSLTEQLDSLEILKKNVEIYDENGEVIQSIETQQITASLQNLQKTIPDLDKLNKEYSEKAEQNKNKTNDQLKTAEERISTLEQGVKNSEKELENYKETKRKEKEAEKLNSQRIERLHNTLHDIFYGFDTQDPTMAKLLDTACKLSPEFKKLFENLKKPPKNRRTFRIKRNKIHLLFWNLMKKNPEWLEIVDQPFTEFALGFVIDNDDEKSTTPQPIIYSSNNKDFLKEEL